MTSLLDLEQKQRYVALLKKRVHALENEIYEMEQEVFEELHGFRNGSEIPFDEAFREAQIYYADHDSFFTHDVKKANSFIVRNCYLNREMVSIVIAGYAATTTITEIKRLLKK